MRTEAIEAELQAVLDLVGVGYLIERWKDDTSHEEDPAAVLAAISHGTYCQCAVCKSASGVGTRWEDVLSLGEHAILSIYQNLSIRQQLFYQSITGVFLSQSTHASVRVYFCTHCKWLIHTG
jgi:hypothetical protein